MRTIAVVLLGVFTATLPTTVVARDAGASGAASHFQTWATAERQRSASTPEPTYQSATTSSETSADGKEGGQTTIPAVRTEYRVACELISDRASGCVNSADPCPEGTTQYREWTVTDTSETPLGTICVSPQQAVAAVAAPPQVTPAMVLAAFRRVPVPELRSVTQPGGRTLVNFETIFYADAEPFTETVTLLGQSVRLEIEPSSFRWEHGDGTASTTSTPGAPYPRKDVVHRYTDAHVTVRHRVVVTWTAQWSLNGGPLQPVGGTVTTTGPLSPLRVVEAVPALSGRR